ncbi:hypothetical protein AK88_04808 [Plasmodium fragile]|uniref:Tryptophan/threonine-rich plasmodium antigen C-terminal domain-containing protein n=1 Tax=Plasmodium fragile TaxID=5857 RepID=A0A0D9QFD2_PLAFR|nr:uncharacterized protein AK88_04808 [Plasmodium fragile]KJP85542.1 hypothetical protein AK88_04808 [Plasmodium fragile]
MELQPLKSLSAPLTNIASRLNVQGLKQMLPELNDDLYMKIFYMVAFMFTCYMLLYLSYNQSLNKKTRSKYDSMGEVYFDQKLIKRSEDIKNQAWKNWMTRLGTDWKHFHNSIKIKKEKWLEGKVNCWDEWLKQLQHKWNHYNEHIDISYKFYILKKSLAWNESHWEHWANEELKHFIEKEWNNWVQQSEDDLNTWVMNEWTEWKDNKISSWFSKNWKRTENAYWARMTKKKWVKSLFKVVRKNWLKWHERTNRELQQWQDWVIAKQDLYMNNHEWDPWIRWKINKYKMLKDIRESLVSKWVAEKQWMTWIEERHHFIMQEKQKMNI